jgi:hypothetical protein
MKITVNHSVWGAAKIILRGKFIALIKCMLGKKKTWKTFRDLSIHFKKLEKNRNPEEVGGH